MQSIYVYFAKQLVVESLDRKREKQHRKVQCDGLIPPVLLLQTMQTQRSIRFHKNNPTKLFSNSQSVLDGSQGLS